MDSAEALSASRLVVALAILAVASVLDVRTRKVRNIYWMAMAAVGLALLPVQIAVDGQNWAYLWIALPIVAILLDVFWEGRPGTRLEKYAPTAKYSVAMIAIVVMGYYWGKVVYFQHLLAVPVMMLVVVALYMLDIVRGGADAKALMSLSVLFPVYPVIASMPLVRGETELATIAFPFSFTILVNAAIIVAICVPVGFLLVNVIRGDLRFPNVVLGRRVDVDKVTSGHVWLMERIDKGEHIIYTRPRRNEDLVKEVDLLKGAGVTRVWVTPKIPFMVPMLASLVLSAVVGNFLLLLFPL